MTDPRTDHHEAEKLFLAGPAGRLEAVLWTPPGVSAPHLAALVCHPHPLYGGTLHNKVVYQAAKTIDRLGVPVLRFNFRGAGLSAGEHDQGRGEQDDARVALDFLASRYPGTPLLLAGFSFGCWVGLRVGCADPRVAELIGLGAPVNGSDFSFLEDCPKPKLFLHGAGDEFGNPYKLVKMVADLPGDNQVSVIEDADHFFAGKLEPMCGQIASWLAARHPELRR